MIALPVLNTLPRPDFVATLSGIFEHSSWVAEAVAEKRPFASLDSLHAAMVAAVDDAGAAAQMALLQAHPMLAPQPGASALTAASAAEQSGHGLTSLDAAEAASFAAANDAYQARFGFPFVIAVRGQRDRAAILAALRTRAANAPAAEAFAALSEVAKIARFRLDDMIEPEGWVSVHVLDTARGQPAVGMRLALHRLSDAAIHPLGEWCTNDDGRCGAPLLQGADMRPGAYQIMFDVAAWRRAKSEPDQGFYEQIPIQFRIDNVRLHYHIPLLVAPFGYSTYRGS